LITMLIGIDQQIKIHEDGSGGVTPIGLV
jgi:hypothetical protein